MANTALEEGINKVGRRFFHYGAIGSLKLNTRKCEVVVFGSDPHAPYPECKIAEQAISVGSEGKCLSSA